MRFLKSFFVIAAATVFSYIHPGFTQSVNPASTVNTVTGEMQLAIPLGTVQGLGGNDYPIAVMYGGGIQTTQVASPVGLGFSYGPGGISRRVIFVPDDNIGADTTLYKQDFSEFQDPPCDKPWWLGLRAALFGSGFLGLLLMPPLNEPVTCIGASFLGQEALKGFTKDVAGIMFNPGNLISGDASTAGYNKDGNGTGFLRGAADDLPDVYFVNTPYISGMLMWDRAGGNISDGHFVFKSTGGSAIKESETVKVRYTLNGNIFTFNITLQNGATLVFDLVQRSNSYNMLYWQAESDGGATPCHADGGVRQKERTPVQWFLTKVFPADYIDGDGDRDPLTNPQMDKGSWIRFVYEKTGGAGTVYARPLPEAQQVDGSTTRISAPGSYGSDPAFVNSCIFEEYYLKQVLTPIQKADFVYTMDRKDDLWFPENSMDWKKEARGQNPAASRITAKTTGNDEIAQPLPRPVLREIRVLNRNSTLLNKITFQTNYFLRPSSFHSYSKNKSGGFVVLSASENPNAACLTLNQITIEDAAGNKMPPVVFSYSRAKNFPQWDAAQISAPSLPGDNKMKFFIERRDYWGYYINNTTMVNDFNKDGMASLVTDVDAWLLEEVAFPGGMIIKWEYEPQRYDAANNNPVKGENVSGSHLQTKYGGGVRVKGIKVVEGTGQQYTRSYFYTDSIGLFVGTADGRTSGHASVEPSPYLSPTDQDLRSLAARGGNYAPAKIMYEMVQVVNNFKPAAAVKTPEGYTVYKFISPKEQQNRGDRGEADYSWKRGMLDSMMTYDKGGIRLSWKRNEYEFHEQQLNEPAVLRWGALHANFDALRQNTCGWVKLKKTESEALGVKNINTLKYAADLAVTTPDFVATTENRIDKMEPWALNPQSTTTWPGLGSNLDLVASFTRTKLLGNTNQTDYVVAALGFEELHLFAGVDVPSVFAPIGTPTERWAEGLLQIGFYFRNILGLKVTNLSATPTNRDILLFIGPDRWSIPFDVNAANDFRCIILKNVRVVGTTTKYLVWDDTPTIIDFNNRAYPQLITMNTIVSCAVGDINGNGKPDVVLLEGKASDPGSPAVPRRLFGFMDIDYSTTNPGGSDQMSCCVSAALTGLGGEQISFVDHDGVGGISDLEITGQAHTGSGHTESNYPIHRTILTNVYMNMATKVLTTNLPPIQEPDYLCLGERTNKNNKSFYYIGMSRMDDAEDSRDKRVFAVYVPWYTGDRRPRLSLISLYPETGNGDYDGMPNLSYTKANDASYLVTTTTPAYWQYMVMGNPATPNNKHTLTPQCGSVTYHLPSTTSETIINGNFTAYRNYVVASTASTWKTENGIYLPKANYAWRVNMDEDGLPVVPWTAFDYGENPIRAPWVFVDSTGKYTGNSLPRETFLMSPSGGSVAASTIYGYDGTIPIAKVGNSGWDECGVFTCDYDMNDGGYFDRENRWIHYDGNLPTGAVCQIESTYPHFGQKSLHVKNAKAVARTIAINSHTAKITRSAWVRPVNTNPIRFAACLVVDGVGNTNYVYDYVYDVAKGLEANGEWQLVSFTIDISKPAGLAPLPVQFEGADDGVFIWVGNHPNEAAAEFYIDDIRVAPVNAYVATTYFDQKWYQPLISVDQNNKPGKRITFDNFGRAIQVDKINVTKTSGVTGYAVTLQEKKYHVRNELPAGKNILLLSPSGGENLQGNKMSIYWVNNGTRNIRIYHKWKVGDSWPADWWNFLPMQSNQSGWCKYDWELATITADCLLKVSIVDAMGNPVESDSLTIPFRVTAP